MERTTLAAALVLVLIAALVSMSHIVKATTGTDTGMTPVLVDSGAIDDGNQQPLESCRAYAQSMAYSNCRGYVEGTQYANCYHSTYDREYKACVGGAVDPIVGAAPVYC